MNITLLQRKMQILRDVGETHPNDIIAIEAARLAHRLESPRFDPLTEADVRLIKFSEEWLTANPRRAITKA